MRPAVQVRPPLFPACRGSAKASQREPPQQSGAQRELQHEGQRHEPQPPSPRKAATLVGFR